MGKRARKTKQKKKAGNIPGCQEVRARWGCLDIPKRSYQFTDSRCSLASLSAGVRVILNFPLSTRTHTQTLEQRAKRERVGGKKASWIISGRKKNNNKKIRKEENLKLHEKVRHLVTFSCYSLCYKKTIIEFLFSCILAISLSLFLQLIRSYLAAIMRIWIGNVICSFFFSSSLFFCVNIWFLFCNCRVIMFPLYCIKIDWVDVNLLDLYYRLCERDEKWSGSLRQCLLSLLFFFTEKSSL